MFEGVPPQPPQPPPMHVLASVRPGSDVTLHAAPGGPVLMRAGAQTEFGSPRVYWVQEQRDGWGRVHDPRLGNRRRAWLRLDAQRLSIGGTGYAVAVDLSARMLRVRRDGRVVQRMRVAIGRGESPTPRGTFQVTDRLLGGRRYGCCVLAISAVQPNLPSGWRGGNRIAIHGSSRPAPVGVAATAGCVRLAPGPLRRLFERLPIGTPVRVRR